jgi:hypothetical protein
MQTPRFSLYFLEQFDVPRQYPYACLKLLWLMCGPGCVGQSGDLAKVLDVLVSAAPKLEIDRRVQWLEQRAIRLG